jgi:hypothetical protein
MSALPQNRSYLAAVVVGAVSFTAAVVFLAMYVAQMFYANGCRNLGCSAVVEAGTPLAFLDYVSIAMGSIIFMIILVVGASSVILMGVFAIKAIKKSLGR